MSSSVIIIKIIVNHQKEQNIMSDFDNIFNSFQSGYNQGVSEFESNPKNPFVIMKIILGVLIIGAIILQCNGVPVFHYLSVAFHWIMSLTK